METLGIENLAIRPSEDGGAGGDGDRSPDCRSSLSFGEGSHGQLGPIGDSRLWESTANLAPEGTAGCGNLSG